MIVRMALALAAETAPAASCRQDQLLEWVPPTRLQRARQACQKHLPNGGPNGG